MKKALPLSSFESLADSLLGIKDKFMNRSNLRNLVYGYSQIRSGQFALQGAMLPIIDSIVNKKVVKKIDYLDHLKLALPKIQVLFKQDAQNIVDGLYPISVLSPENPVLHLTRVPLILIDAFRANSQRKNKQAKKFTNSLENSLNEYPEYYRRNFHFQDEGYLGDKSAYLYEHQVEVLFSGSADAMRRQVIAPLKKHFSSSKGEGLHFLEIGSGTGRLTRFVALAFPKAKITCVDLSPNYLARARSELSEFRNISYVQAASENLDFKDKTFDAIFSSYLFHELPEKIRIQVLSEGHRLLKPQGIYIVADSLQKDDDPELNWALEQFPKDFHEPFYKNYIDKPLENLMAKAGIKVTAQNIGFLTKVVSGVRID